MKKTLFLSLFTLLLFVRIEAQWTEIPLLMGPVLDDLEVHEGKVYTTFYTGGRVKCLSTEDYIHWSLVANLQGSAAFGDAAFIAAGNRLYVFGENEGQSASNAWQSEDGGQNWSAINLPAPAPSFFVPASENLLCASEFVVKSSADYGATWNTVLTVPEKIRDFKKINDQTFLLATFHNLYRSTDQGLTWNALSAPYSISNPNTSRLTIFPAGTVLFLEVNNSSASMLFRTLDEGTTWDLAQVPVLNGNPAVWDMCPVGNTLWGAFQNVIATSVDTGNTWNLQLTPYVPLQLANKGDTLFVGGGAGFFKSYNQAKSWISGNNGWSQAGYFTGYSLPAENIYADQHRLYLSAHNAGLFSTKDDGIEWTMHSKRNGFRHYVYSGDTIMFLQPGALRSLDGADTWDYLPATTTSPLSGFYDFACSSHALFAASWTDTHLRRSIDFGETWQPLSLGISFFEYMAVAGNFLYVADGDGIAVSNNHGQSFQGFSTGLANPNDIDGLWEGNRVIFTKSEGQLWRRKGNQWRPASIGLFNETGNLPFIADINGKEGRILLVSEADAHPLFYLSQDDGDSWEGNWEAGLPAIDTDEPFQGLLHNGVIYALGLPQGEFRNRLWKRSLPVPAQEAVSEQNFHLFPNPAKEVVTIDFIAQTVFRGTVILHDFSGRRVWQQEFTGTSQVQIPVKDLPAGIYSASVYSENGKITQAKLVVAH